MLIETGRVAAIDADCLWVETIQKSACGSCSAQKGCGQSLLARLGAKPSYLRVLPGDNHAVADFSLGDQVEIGVPESVVVSGSLVAYFVPLLLFVIGAAVGQHYFVSEAAVILMAFAGLVGGGLAVRVMASLAKNNQDYQPVLVGLCRPAPELVASSIVINSDKVL